MLQQSSQWHAPAVRWLTACAFATAFISSVSSATPAPQGCRGFLLTDFEVNPAGFPGCIMWLPKTDPDPVDLATGAYLMDELDSTLPGMAGQDFEFRRYYDGGTNLNGPLGQKWDSPVFRRIHDGGGSSIEFCSGRGRKESFQVAQVQPTLVTYTTPPGLYFSLEKRQTNGLWTFHMTDANGVTDVFEPTVTTGVGVWFRLRDTTDPHGNRIQYVYDAQDRLISITDTTGGVHTLKYVSSGVNADRVETFTDAAGRTTGYEYDANGDLVAVVRPKTAKFPQGTKDTFTYVTGSRLESATQAGKPKPYLINTYDSNGRVVAQQFGEGPAVTQIDYANFPWVTVTDREGNVVDYHVDAATHNILQRVAHDSQSGATTTTTYLYDAQGYPDKVVLADGRIIDYAFDTANPNPRSRSNLLFVEVKASATDPNPRRTTWTYTPDFNRVATKTSARMNAAYSANPPDSAKTRYTYDAKGSLTKVQFPDVATPNGPQLIDVEFSYDALGRMTKRIEPNGSETVYVYDPLKADPFAKTEIRDALGDAIATDYTYNKAHSPLTISSNCACPTGSEVTNVYDARNDLIEVRRKVDASTTQVAQFERDENGNVTQRRDADDSAVGDGWATRDFTFDRLNNVIKIVEDVDSSTRLTAHFSYDAKQRLIEEVDPNGVVVRFTYDENDELLSVRRVGDLADPSDDIVTNYEYDGLGRLTRITDPRSAVTSLQYGPYGLPERVTYPLGSYVVLAFDEDDNLLATRAYDATHQLIGETLAQYDQQNRVTERKSRYVRGDGQPVGDGYLSMVFEYDEMGNMTLQEREDGSRLAIAYDGLGRPISVRDSVVPVNGWNFDYAADGALEALWRVEGDERTGNSTTWLAGRIVSKDAIGRPLEIEDAAGASRTLEWTLSGGVKRFVDRAGRASATTFDERGRPLLKTREVTPGALGASGPISTLHAYAGTRLDSVVAITGGSADQVTSYDYDAFSRLTDAHYADGTSEHVQYDAMSNVVRSEDPNQNVITATYDLLNRMESFNVARGPGITGETFGVFTYDARGRIATARNDDYLVTRTYNSLDAMESETVVPANSAWSRSVRADYDAVGRLSRVYYPGHTVAVPDFVQFAWDGIDRLREVRKFEGAAQRVVANYSYLGRLPVLEQSAMRSTARDYDLLRRLVSIDHTAASRPIASISLAYDPEGKVTGTFRRFFDGSGNPIAARNYDGGALYEYDDAGELQRSYSGLTLAQYNAANPANAKLTENYSFDRVWNLTQRATYRGATPSFVGFVVNLVNEYVQVAGLTQTYDANGNLKSQNGGAAATYDHRNLPMTLPSAPNDLRMQYDVFGRRIETWAGQSAQSERMSYWDWQELARSATVGSTTTEFEYHPGNGLDHVLESVDRSTGVLSQLFGNEIESLIATTDTAGNVTESFRYNDYGRRFRAHPTTGAILPDPAPSVFNQQIGFQGRWTVAGVEKYLDFRNRVYLPDWGRFAQQDPLGFVDGSMNRCQLGRNDPRRRDPYGLSPNEDGTPGDAPGSCTHCSQTTEAAQAAGISESDACEMEYFNWRQDTEGRAAAGGFGCNVDTYFHALDDDVARDRWLAFWAEVNAKQCSTELMGIYLHFLQDYVYHVSATYHKGESARGKYFGSCIGHGEQSAHCSSCDGFGGAKRAAVVNFTRIKTSGKTNCYGCPDHPTCPEEREIRNWYSIEWSRSVLAEWRNHCGSKGSLDTWKDYDTNGRPPPSTKGPSTPGPDGPSTGGHGGTTSQPRTGGPGGASAPGSGGSASTGGPSGPATGSSTGGTQKPVTETPSTPAPAGPSTGGPSTPKSDTTPTGGGGTVTGPSTGGGHGGSNAGKGKKDEKTKPKTKSKGGR